MGLLSNHGQFTEVFVEGNENPPLLMGEGHDLIIARISRPVSSPDDIVACRLQRSHGDTRNAGIEQQFHEADSRDRGSIRSWPTSRWA